MVNLKKYVIVNHKLYCFLGEKKMICDRCGKKYYPLDDNAKFEHMHSNEYGTYAYIYDLSDEFLCLDCAIDEYNK